jgi:hypothetical protein
MRASVRNDLTSDNATSEASYVTLYFTIESHVLAGFAFSVGPVCYLSQV